MKMTKRIAAMAACAVMAVTSMVGMSASAATDDHGNTMATATTFTGSITGKIETAGDVDFFKYTATTNGIRYFYTTGNNSIINIYDSSGTSVSSSLDFYSNKKLTGYNMTKNSTYYISVREYGSTYGTSYTLGSGTSLSISHLYQGSSPWGTVKLNGSSSTIADAGCALTAFTMMTNFMKDTSKVPTDFNNSTYISEGDFQWYGPQALGYSCKPFSTESEAITYLSKGIPVMLRLSGHFVVAVGYQNGMFYASDPGASSSALKSINPSSVIQRIVYIP